MQAKFKAAFRQVVTTAILALGIALLIPVFVHRRHYDAAVVNWVRNPTAENHAVLRAEALKSERVAFRTQMEVGGILFMLFNGVWFCYQVLQMRHRFRLNRD